MNLAKCRLTQAINYIKGGTSCTGSLAHRAKHIQNEQFMIKDRTGKVIKALCAGVQVH